MKKIFSIILASFTIFISCEDDLNINTNPNTPPEITTGLALSAAQGSIATVIGGELFNLGGMYAQFYTQAPSAGQYDDIEQYNVTTDFADRLWIELYAGALNDLEFVKTESLAAEDTGTYLIATLLQAYTFQYLVDVFGDVPYMDALQGSGNIAPPPTPGQEIYTDLLARIDEALTAYENNPVATDVGNQDFIYGGDMENWIEFANTLKLKMYLRMAYTSQANSSAVMALMAEDNFLTEDADMAVFTDALNKRHPFYEVQIDYLGNVNTVASNSLLEFYNQNNDPRMQEVYTVNNAGDYVGIDQGAGLTNEYNNFLATQFSRPEIEPTHPVFFMTVAESYFLQAEALLRYAGGQGVEEKYNAGVAASFDLYASIPGDDNAIAGVDPGTFTGPGGVYEYQATGDIEADLEQIIEQKWASLANINNLEAWIETLRTGYPEIVDEEDPAYAEGVRIISLGSVLPPGQLPVTLFYPDNEIQRNTNLTQKPNLFGKVWWNQK